MAANTVILNQKLENPKLRELLNKRAEFAPKPNADGTLPQLEDSAREKLGKILEEFVEEFVNSSKVLVPVQLSKEPLRSGEVLTIGQNTDVNFAVLSAADAHFLPVFTDSEEFSKWTHEPIPYTVLMDFDNLALLFENTDALSGIAVNAFSDNQIFPRGLLLNWWEQKQIRIKGHAAHVIGPNTPYKLFTPSPYPMELSNKLCEIAKSVPGIRKLWLRGIELNGENGYLLIVDFSGERTAVFTPLGEASKPYLRDKALHIISLTDGFGETASDKIIPIYERE